MPTLLSRFGLSALFIARLARRPRGRAFLLHMLLGAEEADELGVFDTLLARVDDPELGMLVRRHKDDEDRHAAILSARLEALGDDARSVPIPAELGVVQWIDRALGDVGEGFVAGRRGVMDAYLLLQVLEERAVAQYPLFADALRPHDPESAAIIDAIVDDERRHVKYARAISRRYAPDETTLARELSRTRAAEARAFAAHGRRLQRFAVEHDLLEARGLERALWRGVAALAAMA